MRHNRILFISNLYPNPLAPHSATFSLQQMSSLKSFSNIDVIAPVGWTSRLRATVPYHYTDKGIDVFHPTYFYTPGYLRSLYGQFYLTSISRVAEKLLKTRKYDCIYSSWLFPDGWAAAKLAKKYNLPLFIRVVGTDVNRLCSGDSVTEKSLWAVNQASRVLAVSKKLKESLVALGADPEKIEVIYNGVNRSVFYPMDRQQLRSELGVSAERKVILFVGNLKKEKGVLELTEAFARLVQHRPAMDLELVIIGSGHVDQQMRQSLAANNVSDDRVRFLGSKPIHDVAKWLNVCDVFCLPSYMEGMPNVVIEALACQTRVVTTNVGGIPELDEGLGNMRLVEPRSVSQLQSALDDMLQIIEYQPVESDVIGTWEDNAARVYGLFKEGA